MLSELRGTAERLAGLGRGFEPARVSGDDAGALVDAATRLERRGLDPGSGRGAGGGGERVAAGGMRIARGVAGEEGRFLEGACETHLEAG